MSEVPLYTVSVSQRCPAAVTKMTPNAKPNLRQDPVLIYLTSHPEPQRLSFSMRNSHMGKLAHEKLRPPRTLQQAYAQGPREVLGGGSFL